MMNRFLDYLDYCYLLQSTWLSLGGGKILLLYIKDCTNPHGMLKTVSSQKTDRN